MLMTDAFMNARLREHKDVNTDLIVLSDVWLDRPSVMRGLRHLLGKYDEICSSDGLERRCAHACTPDALNSQP